MKLFARRSARVADLAPAAYRLRRAVAETLEDRQLLAADIGVTLMRSPAQANAGANITYTLTVRNIGDAAASLVNFDFDPDTVVTPPNERATFQSVLQTGGPAFNIIQPAQDTQGDVSGNISSMAPADAATFVIVYKVLSNVAGGTTLNSAVSATTSTAGDPTGNNTDTVTTSIGTSADVQISKVKIGTPNVIAGTNATFEFTVVNGGSSDAANVTFTDIVPSGSTFVIASQISGPTFTLLSVPSVGSGGTYSGIISTLAPNTPAKFSITLNVPSSALDTDTLSNTASVTTTTTDPANGNNLSTATAPVDRQSDLEITSTANRAAPIIEGNVFSYEVAVKNNGPSDSSGVSFTWQMPDTGNSSGRERIYFADGPTQSGGYNPVQQLTGPAFSLTVPPITPNRFGNVTGSITTLPAGVGATFRIFVITSEDNTATNQATITGANESDPSNNTSPLETVIIEDAPLVVDSVPNIQGNVNQQVNVQAMVFHDTNSFPGLAGNNPAPPAYTTPGGRFAERNDFNATIDWGDNTGPLPASIAVNGNGTYDVIGSHTYTTAGQFAVHILVTSDGASTAVGDSIATVGILNRGVAAVGGLKFTENVTETKQVGTFFPGPNSSGLTFTGTINWGDGTPNSAATLTQSPGGQYIVTGTHDYLDEGTYTGQLTITDNNGQTDQVVMIVTVDDRAVVGQAVNFTATAGVTATNVTVATFTDPGGRAANNGDPLSSYVASIDWGDGTPVSNGVISYDSGTGVFTVRSSHQYSTAGVYNLIVTLSHKTAPDTVVQPQAVVSVGSTGSNPAVVPTAVNVNASINNPFTGTVATFTDPITPDDPVSAYTAIIDWGDGTATSNGTITYNSQTQVFTVAGTHTFTSAGTFNMTVTISHTGSPNATTNPTATVTTQPANPAVNATGNNFTVTTNNAFTNQVVATFTDPGPDDLPANYTATIDWGDGTNVSNGTITVDNSGTYSVAGGHTYNTAGSYTVTVTITHGNSQSTTVTPTATVIDAPPATNGVGVNVSAVEGQTANNVIVARFQSATGTTPSDFDITIDWGDGRTSTGRAVASTVNGTVQNYNVVGSHQYRNNGTYTITTTVSTDPNLTPLTITSTAAVADAALRGISRLFRANRGVTFNGIVGSFEDGNPFDKTPSDYQVTIDWGDGTATTGGTVTYNSTLQRFDVRGSHTYQKTSPTGGFDVIISIRDNLATASVTSTATVT